jgi:hypothetical protein
MAAIDQRGQLDPRRTPERTDSIHRRTHCSAGEENIVYDNYSTTFQRQRQARDLHYRQFRAPTDVITVHRDVDRAHIDVYFFNCRNRIGNPSRDLIPAGRNSGKDDLRQRRIALNNFMRNPSQRATNGFRVHHEDGGISSRI